MYMESYTTGQIAQICRVTKRTVIKWIDSGKLPGYRIPDSKHRRVTSRDLAEFMRKHHIPGGDEVGPRPRVLIIDDDYDFAALLRDALLGQYIIEHAGSAMEAASRMPVFKPDLVLVDIRLPDLNGMEVCRHFRSFGGERRPAILAMSAYGHELDVNEVRSSGADDFIPKPLKLAELRRRIRVMVG
ncbi:MAG: response regulator [Planctomycetes bacterium]|nr:response regulator [Planctomycetota bacterium]